jgi:CRISPR-associated protein Csm4
MNLYRARLRLRTASGSLWQSDTLFGHMCWLVVHRDGEGGLRRFLEPFLGGQPPFVLSDGFPEETLPHPVILGTFSRGRKVLDVREYGKQKLRAKAHYLMRTQFLEFARTGAYTDEPPAIKWETHQMLHAAIDRNTIRTGGASSGGDLYQTEAVFPVRSFAGEWFPTSLDIYLRATAEGLGVVRDLLVELSVLGYGKDRGVGAGHFDFDPESAIEQVDDLDEVHCANGFVSLSSYVPSVGDPLEGYWRIRTKRGRLGDERAQSSLPFKRPILQLEPGAVFLAPNGVRPYYGRIVEGISPSFDDTVQNGYTVALPIKAQVDRF